jgi:hypothetical protein
MQKTRQILFAVAITVSVIVTIASAALITNPSAFFASHSERDIAGTNKEDRRMGTISFEIDPDHCQQAKFDNVTGRITEPRPCDNRIISDSRGMPVPMGTMHRLESIRKSFAGGGK